MLTSNAAVCLAFVFDKGTKMKGGSCCRERKMQFSGPTLRSLVNFYIELEQLAVHFRRHQA